MSRAVVDTLEYRRGVGRVATGGTIVTTRAHGMHHAMTVNSFTSVSLDPVLVLFCAEKISRFHDAALESGVWGVSVLGVEHERLSRWFATRGRPADNQFEGHAFSYGASTGAML